MNIVDLPKLYTEDEVAQYLQVDPETVARERRRGRLKFTLVGNRPRFKVTHIEEYLEARECAATSNDEKKTGSGTSTNTTSKPDNAAALQLAREISRKQTKSLQRTSSHSPIDNSSMT